MSHVRSLNRVILVGRVGQNPEITHIPSLGKDVAKFSLATNEGYMDKNQQWQDTTEWHNIVAWGPLAQKVERQVGKGAMVLIEGKLKTRKWQDKEGHDRRTTEVYVDNLVVLEKSDRVGSSAGTGEREGYIPNGTEESLPNAAPPEKDINDFPMDDEEGDPF